MKKKREEMPELNFDQYWEDELETLESRHPKRGQKQDAQLVGREKRLRYLADLAQHAEAAPDEMQHNFMPTFRPAEHERYWLMNYLEGFYNSQVITDILWKARGGKEANVYCCAAHPSTGLDLIAAKVYRPRMLRNLRNDARYRQGREVTDEEGKDSFGRREALAMRKNTRFGQTLRQISWLEAEFRTMQALYEAGADVPMPVTQGNNVILMEYIGEERVPAPTLNQVWLSKAEAEPLFARLVDNLGIMLSCSRVHADFSAYNILYWDGSLKIIDFPQAVDPRRNPDARDLFIRDVERLCSYFVRYGIRCNAHKLANELWERYVLVNALDAGLRLE